MPDEPEEGSLAHHLGHLAADAEDVEAVLTRAHKAGGDIRPEELGKAQHLSTSLREVIATLTQHHEHLAVTADDVWHMLTIKHDAHGDDPVT